MTSRKKQMQLTTQDIQELIKAVKFDEKLDQKVLQYFRPKDYINRQHGSTCRELVANLSDADLISVFKALVCIERELKWIGGSVAGAIWVYGIIQNRGLDREYKIADFGLRNCDNPWVPFGGSYYGKRTIEDYFSLRTAKATESKMKADRYEKILKRVEGRKEKRAEAINELRKLSTEKRGEIRNDLLAKYKNATVVEKLELIASDTKFPPEYYPIEWISISVDEIEKLPLELIKKLYDRLSTKTKGEWKRFAHKLEKLDNGI
jgi:hypothetical protein